jgi:predicted MFS family arabinose efflux permease
MTQQPTDPASVRRRFLVLLALRWLPTGLMIPVLVLLLLERGLTLAQLGLMFAAQGLVVLVLELPTGGFADALGRRRVLLIASVFEIGAIAMLIAADSAAGLALAFALLGVYRALESGPLDSWYVDTAQALDPDADIERGLSLGGIVLSVALGAGSLLSSLIVALDPLPAVDALVTPLIVALVLIGVEFVAISILMTESPPPVSASGLRQVLAEVPAIIVGSIRTVRASTVLIALVSVEFLWGFGMISFETFTPARLATVMGNADQAATVLGPASAGAWLAAAGGAALVPVLTRRWRPAYAAAGLRIAQGVTVLGIAFAVGSIGVVVAYVLTIGINGASNPIHQAMLHRAIVEPGSRATMVSVNSLTAQAGSMLGGIGLGMLADATSLTTAIVVGAIILSAAAPLYLIVARRTSQ